MDRVRAQADSRIEKAKRVAWLEGAVIDSSVRYLLRGAGWLFVAASLARSDEM